MRNVTLDREQLEQLLVDPAVQARVAEVFEEAELGRRRGRLWRRAMPLMASFFAASVTALAFLIPSLQDQWDRWKARAVVDTYVEIGQRLLGEHSYAQAASAFTKAQELSDAPRIDIEEGRLRSSTSEVLDEPAWRVANPAGLEESSFIVLEHLERDHADASTRAETLSHHGLFLVSEGRDQEAERAFRAAIALDPSTAEARVNLGNLLADGGRTHEAEREYRNAIRVDPANVDARFNLGLLLEDTDRLSEALTELQRATELATDDDEALLTLARLLDRSGQSAAAEDARRRAKRLGAAHPSAHAMGEPG